MKNRPTDGIMVSNQSLVLQDVTRARSGEYTCIASNQEGDGTSNTVNLNVKCEYITSDRTTNRIKFSLQPQDIL